MIDKRKLRDELTEAFIGYQHRVDCPFPSTTETEASIIAKYRHDHIFRAKVDGIVVGVLHIVSKHIDQDESLMTGHVRVPVEPSIAMIDAFVSYRDGESACDCYAMLLSAAKEEN